MPFTYKGNTYKTMAEAEAAFEADAKALAVREEALRAATTTAVAKPLSIAATYRGQLEVRLGEVHDGGNYPVLSVTGMQFEGLIANIDQIKAAYETAKAKGLIARTWKDMKPSIKDKASKPKPTAIEVAPPTA